MEGKSIHTTSAWLRVTADAKARHDKVNAFIRVHSTINELPEETKTPGG